MFNKKRKVIYSLLAVTILSSSAANAANYNFTSNKYDSRYNYSYSNSSKFEQSTVVKKYPTFNWSIGNTKPSKPNRPGTNVPNSPDYNWNNRPNKPSKPNRPETPTEKPNKPETPTEKPDEPTNPTPPVSGISSIEMEVVRLVNIERQKEGLAPLVASSALSNVARKKSEDMAVNNYFSHNSPTYGSPSNMMKTFGINSSYSGENIAKGQTSAQSVVRAWMNSSGHRANIMNPNFKNIGVGHYQSSNGTNLWTQMFTN